MSHDESRVERLARFMLRKVNKAVYEFGMIEYGDRIAVALSGGKDCRKVTQNLVWACLMSIERT